MKNYQVPDFRALEEMNEFLAATGAGFTIDRLDENLNVTIQIWKGKDEDGGENFIGFLGFETPDIEALNDDYDQFAAYCFTSKTTQAHFEDESYRYYFSLEKRSLFVIETSVSLTAIGPIYFKDKALAAKTIDGHTLQLPEA